MQSLGVLKEWVAIGFLNTNPFFFAKYKNQNMNQSHLFSPHLKKEQIFYSKQALQNQNSIQLTPN